MKLAYDLGGHNGDDTEHYMREGYRTICIEAAPNLVEKLKARFSAEIALGKCVVLGVAIGNTAGTLPFYLCRESAIWNSFDKTMASRNGYHADEIQIPFRRLDSVIAEYGVGEFVKIDIEGADDIAVMSFTRETAPKYLSFEAGRGAANLIAHLQSIGYTRFNLIRQDTWQPVIIPKPGTLAHTKWSSRQWLRLWLRRHPAILGMLKRTKSSKEGTHAGVATGLYKVDSSGPTPMEHKDGWRNLDELMHDWEAVLYSGMIDTVWYDIHAAKAL